MEEVINHPLSEKAEKIWRAKYARTKENGEKETWEEGWEFEWNLSFTPRIKDISNQKFGRLLALIPTNEREFRCPVWVCLCDCGNIYKVRSTSLMGGNTKSCGCLENGERINRLEEGEAAFNKLYSRYKRDAKNDNREFLLSKEEFRKIVTSDCYICGAKPAHIYYGKRLNGTFIYNGVDRVNNSIGYNINNCQPCCGSCNFRKSDLDLNELFQWVKRVYEYNEL